MTTIALLPAHEIAMRTTLLGMTTESRARADHEKIESTRDTLHRTDPLKNNIDAVTTTNTTIAVTAVGMTVTTRITVTAVTTAVDMTTKVHRPIGIVTSAVTGTNDVTTKIAVITEVRVGIRSPIESVRESRRSTFSLFTQRICTSILPNLIASKRVRDPRTRAKRRHLWHKA